jgi:hypothetical protein
MADAFETILVAWLAFAFLPERPTRSQGGTDASNPLSSTGESTANLSFRVGIASMTVGCDLVIIGPDAPRPDEILVVMAIADGGRLRNRCDTEPIW